MDPNAVQHINVKIFVDKSSEFRLDDTIRVFHRWIRDSIRPELLIDVADYQHVPAGPGVLLIGHEANYSLDNRENRIGLLYNRKSELDGTFESRVRQAHRSALEACELLEKEPEFEGKLHFDRKTLEVFVNDRLLAPNTDGTWQVLQPELEKCFPGFTIKREGEPRDLLRAAVAGN